MSIYATKTGLWSDPTVWNTGVLPISTDVVRPNNFIVTMDVDATVAEIRNDAGGGAVANGRFIINSGVSIIATTITVGQAGVRLITHSGVGTASITGTITNLSTNAQYLAIINESSGTLNLIGNVVFTQNNSTVTLEGFIQNLTDGIINITGTVNGNTLGFNRCQCVVNVSIGTINIFGNVNSPLGISTLFTTLVNASTGTITINGNVTTTASITIDNRSTGLVTVTGNITSSGGSSIINSAGTITVNGNVSHTQAAQVLSTIIDNLGSGDITITGDVSSANTSSVNAATGNLIRNNSSGTISIIGELSLTAFANTNSNTTVSILNNSTGIINVTGSVIGQNRTGGFSSSGILNASTGVVNVTGNIQAGATLVTGGSYAIRNTGLGVVNVIGMVLGNGGDNRLCGIGNDGGGTVNITGNVIGGSTGLAVVNNSTGTLTVNGNAIGGTGFQAIQGVSSAGNTIVERAVYSNLGQSPITGYIKFKTTNPEIDVLREDSVIVTLRDPLNVSGLLPATNNVRSGTIYNTGSSTGTLAMPAPNLVQLGVPVGATFGTANLTPGDFWDYLISNGFATGSIGERLKETATTDIVGNIIASFNI